MSTPEIPGLLFVDHVAISVPTGQLEGQVEVYKRLGFKELHREEVYGGDLVREVLLQVGESDNLIQLLEPINADSPVAKQLEKQGGRGGLAHVAFRVQNAQETFDSMKNLGFNIIDPAPRPGSRGTTVFFVHPKTHDLAALGVLYEIVQEGEGSH